MRASARPSRPLAAAYIVTCEHGGNRIPAEYAPLFRGHHRLLATHRGYDPGALTMAHALARALGAVLVASTISRLLVELNRSPGRQFLFSPIMRGAPDAVRDDVCRRYYTPYRSKVEGCIRQLVASGRHVVHVSSHSFTPLLDGIARRADAGLLYDPDRTGERDLCLSWQRALRNRAPDWIVRRNYPYLGRSDGFTSYLRRRFAKSLYTGIELELNQKHVLGGHAIDARERVAVVGALQDALAHRRTASLSASDAR